nr:ferritin-like domain-containing protein [Croceicoccus sp. YJ47]
MTWSQRSVGEAVRAVLLTGDAQAKVMATRALVRDWRAGRLDFRFDCAMPHEPARPDRPELHPARDMPRRGKGGSERGRIALWHSLAHIEFTAIDLALDMVGRFGGGMARGFTDDFLSVAADEAMHYALLDRKLRTMGSHYGALPAHAGLWEAAQDTRHDVAARLAIVPMVLEARGLDITPMTLERVRAQGDANGARILSRILDDEIRHVRFGTKHFVDEVKKRGKTPESYWQTLVREHFRGRLKPPFNDSARESAGLSRSFLDGIA